MPTDVFKTRKGAPAIEINGVGLVDDDHAIPVDRAALVMGELQDKNGRPLTGTALRSAAKRWAEAVGLQVGGSDDPQPARPQRKRPRARRKATLAAAPPELQVGQGVSDPEDDSAAAAAVATAETNEPPSAAQPAYDEIKE